jgi:hypothetical protein
MGCTLKAERPTQEWLSSFADDDVTIGHSYSSSSLFIETKIQELFQRIGEEDIAVPTPVKAAVCADLLLRICETKTSMPEVTNST